MLEIWKLPKAERNAINHRLSQLIANRERYRYEVQNYAERMKVANENLEITEQEIGKIIGAPAPKRHIAKQLRLC